MRNAVGSSSDGTRLHILSDSTCAGVWDNTHLQRSIIDTETFYCDLRDQLVVHYRISFVDNMYSNLTDVPVETLYRCTTVTIDFLYAIS